MSLACVIAFFNERNVDSKMTFFLGFTTLVLLNVYLLPSKIEVNKRIVPELRIKVVDGKADTTFVYKEPWSK
jgi:hypothetical protein